MLRHNPHVMEIDCGRNCYSCREFGHLTRNCRNRKIMGQERRLEYGENTNNSNLNGKESLVVFD